jgi:hypothetical protein
LIAPIIGRRRKLRGDSRSRIAGVSHCCSEESGCGGRSGDGGRFKRWSMTWSKKQTSPCPQTKALVDEVNSTDFEAVGHNSTCQMSRSDSPRLARWLKRGRLPPSSIITSRVTRPLLSCWMTPGLGLRATCLLSEKAARDLGWG